VNFVVENRNENPGLDLQFLEAEFSRNPGDVVAKPRSAADFPSVERFRESWSLTWLLIPCLKSSVLFEPFRKHLNALSDFHLRIVA